MSLNTMIINRNPVIVFLFSLTLFSIASWTTKAHHNINNSSPTMPCKRTCGGSKHGSPTLSLQYPFGFSEGCEIRLNCSAAGKPTLGQFPVQSVNPDSIRISLQRKCDRPLHQTVDELFGERFAPTSRNAILLENCTDAWQPCEIPSMLVQTHFSSLSCVAGRGDGKIGNGSDSMNISCYSERNTSAFIDAAKLRGRHCSFLLSSISASGVEEAPVSLAVGVIELGWWVEGDCGGCDHNANCTSLPLPKGGRGFRCRCNEGFRGDGFHAGLGCRKANPKCNPARFFRGKCGGSKLVTLICAIAVAISLTITLGLITCCFYRRRAKQKARSLTKRRISEATGNLNIPIYPYKDIDKATSGFSDKYRLGTGAYGTVYAGKLNSDEWLAIKRIRHRAAANDAFEQVVNEIKLISSVNHPNLVRLLGCSVDYGEQILVYEFMPNGTLCQHLQRERGDGIPWLIRLTIAAETAQAIAHLHSGIKPPIYHRDIKSSNILLDHNFRSKVADFGLSRLGIAETSHISTAPQGTPGYLDPQYHQNFQLSDKSDVYSFGVVLVEIITGMKAVDFSRPQNEVNLANLAADRIGRGCVDEIIDPLLDANRDAWTLSSVHKVAELAFRCLAFHRDVRPSMREVAEELERLRRSRSWQGSEEENTCTASSEACSSSSSSNVSEKPLRSTGSCRGSTRLDVLMAQVGGDSFSSERAVKEESPVSVQDVWLSEHSSPSSNSLLRNPAHLSN